MTTYSKGDRVLVHAEKHYPATIERIEILPKQRGMDTPAIYYEESVDLFDLTEGQTIRIGVILDDESLRRNYTGGITYHPPRDIKPQ